MEEVTAVDMVGMATAMDMEDTVMAVMAMEDMAMEDMVTAVMVTAVMVTEATVTEAMAAVAMVTAGVRSSSGITGGQARLRSASVRGFTGAEQTALAASE